MILAWRSVADPTVARILSTKYILDDGFAFDAAAVRARMDDYEAPQRSAGLTTDMVGRNVCRRAGATAISWRRHAGEIGADPLRFCENHLYDQASGEFRIVAPIRNMSVMAAAIR